MISVARKIHMASLPLLIGAPMWSSGSSATACAIASSTFLFQLAPLASRYWCEEAILLPSPSVLRGRGVGGEGVEALGCSAPSPPTPLPRVQGRGAQKSRPEGEGERRRHPIQQQERKQRGQIKQR